MLPIIVAGSRPAAAVLAQRRYFDCDTSVELHRLLHASITDTGRSRVSISSTVLFDPIDSRRPPNVPRPNRHRARSTASRIPSRDFLLWRFSNAGPQPRSSPRRPSRAGIRKPSKKRKSQRCRSMSALAQIANVRRAQSTVGRCAEQSSYRRVRFHFRTWDNLDAKTQQIQMLPKVFGVPTGNRTPVFTVKGLGLCL